MANLVSDQEMIAILADMADSVAPALSPIKSPKRQRDTDSPAEIPEPALKQHKPEQTEGMKNIRNRLTSLETRRAKCKRSLQVLREHARNSTCPYGLQYRPKPHIRFDRKFQTSMDQICQRAHAELLTLMIKEQEKNLAADNQAIQAQQQRLQNLCPNQPSSQAARNRAKPRMRPKPHVKKVQQTCNLASMQAQLSELQKMFCKMSETMSVNKDRVEQYSMVCFSDSRGPKRNTIKENKKRSYRRNSLKNTLAHNSRAQNEKYIKNFSNKALSDDEVKLLSRGLKFIPTPLVPTSNKSLLKDFNNFARTMRLRYLFANRKKTTAHPFHVKSTWQPPIQNSVALENYLEETKLELASIVFYPQNDNISANERKAISTLKRNSEINLKKADKGTTIVIMDTAQKIQEGSQQLSDDKFYKPLASPIVQETSRKVNAIVYKLFCSGHIDKMTHKWLTTDLKQPRIPEFYTLTKIHKKTLVGRPIVSGSSGPTERISSFVDSLLQPIATKQESYLKDTTDFINFIENTQIPDDVILATLDVSSLYTNIPQSEGIDVICRHYEDHYEQKLPIPTNDLRELMRLILEENSFKFNERHFLQTHGVAMGTKMAVAFSVIFMADLEKRLLTASPFKPLVWKRFIDDIFSLWNIPNKEVSEFVNFANSFHQTIKFTCEMSSERAVFLDTEVFKGPRHSTHKTLDLQTHFKPTETFQYTHFSSCHPFNSKKGFFSKEKHYVF